MDRNGAAELARQLGVKADKFGIESLNEDQKNVLVPYWALGAIENGGFRYALQGERDLVDIARRFRALGFSEVASACERVARSVFGPAGDPGGAQRKPLLARVDWDAFDAEEAVVFAVSWEALEDAIVEYVSSHPETGAQD